MVLLVLDVEEVESERGFTTLLGVELSLFGVEGRAEGLLGTLCERASGEPFLGVQGLAHRARPKPQLVLLEEVFEEERNMFSDNTFSDETARECVGAGLVSREGVGVRECEESMEEVGESFLKGKGRRDNDFGFDQ